MARIIGIITFVLATGNAAFGQFMVNPMRIEEAVQRGRQFAASISIDNTLIDEAQVIDLRIVDLTQGPNGLWKPIEADDPAADASNLRSCRSWLTLERTRVDLPPLQRAPVRVQIRVPTGTWGYYFAGIVASMQPRTDIEGYGAGLGLDFLVPVILHVQGRGLDRRVSLKDIDMRFQPQSDDTLAASLVNLEVANAGMSYSRLEMVARISKRMGGRMRRVTEIRFPPEGDLGIIPGVTLNLAQDVGRPLPPGEYFLEGFLVVDGRRTDRMEKEIRFSGDPRLPASDPSLDAPLDILPVELAIQAPPGSTRMERFMVYNASEEPVNVEARAVLPEHMIAAVLPEDAKGRTIRGNQFGCADWVTFQPSEFTLQGYGRQTVGVRARIPQSSADLPEYYAVIELNSRYADGQSAGTTRGRLYVENTSVEGLPRVEIVRLTLSEAAPSRYILAAQCVNLGDVRGLPRCRAVVRSYPDEVEQRRIELNSETFGETGTLLPMERRTFQGVLDVSTLEPGRYRLAVVFEHDGGAVGELTAQRHRGFDVIEENGVRSIQELSLDEVGGVIPVRL